MTTFIEGRMLKIIAPFAVSLLMVLGSITIAAAAKPSGPVRVEYSLPANVKSGDVVTTVLTFRALEDIDRLAVSLAPFKGLEIVSDPKDATFTAVKRGEGPQLSVTIRLTEEPFGYLSVTYQTQQGTTVDGGATMVVYGSKNGQQ